MSKINKVLIVEDDALTAYDLSCILQDNNIKDVHILNSAEKAFESVSDYLPQIIFLDISLKGKMNGIDFAIDFRKGSDIPIIIMSAYPESQFEDVLEKIKPVFFLKKPFNEFHVKEYLDSIIK